MCTLRTSRRRATNEAIVAIRQCVIVYNNMIEEETIISNKQGGEDNDSRKVEYCIKFKC